MSRIVGIDLGTTNSLVGYVDETTGLPRVIPDAEGRVLLPSVVSFTREGVLVGEAAKRLLVRRPATTIYSVKRLMGRGYEDIKEELCYLPFKVVPCDGIVKIQVEDREVTPPQVSAIVLKSLKERAEQHFGEPIEKAVITVPAYFNDSQRQATKDAGRIAGLDVVRIVNEPTAASLAYGLHRLKEGVIAVYDLGGGTFDISILRVKDGVFEVLATNGNTHLGGDDFDRAIVVWLLDDIRSKHGVYLGRDSEAMQELRLAAEAAKIRLSVDERAALTIPFDGFTYHREIARTELEELIGKLVDSTLGPCRVALADASLGSSDIDEVVLVGGSTRVPLLRRRVRELFGKTPHSQLNPDEVVALGAAVQAHILAGGITSMLLLDVTPLSLGIETLGGIVSALIPRNTTIPTSAREMFTTSVDGQTIVDLHVVQGERELAKDCRSLARFELSGIDPMPAGMPKIEVTFLIDANGILQAQAKELRTGKAAAIEVRPTYGLTEAEVERMVEESFAYAEADVEARLLIETRNEADTVITHVERALRQGGELVSGDERESIRAALEELRRVRAADDREQIREKTTALNRATEHLAEVMMDAALKGALGSKRAAEIMESK
ncbi:MAG: molecular chaperone DnaK [Candidatus Rokubacteria bacterium 13_1_20CM_2_69_58]|nr:MAG: molecular chaperone DnaK [Candidatus Rokubacteria bacterium 13_2_20CM_70_12]OLC98716.1 MAG: molecular chaperone DnaK [Candidatus Rokubacteria bacterium 13_1_40CM_3_69_38]OLD74412.1 MAG: molecular chaperone DnaK [Candidatus Rokubacteria bacterium 13_1_20CM_4_70_14]OLE50398.1 MAG: molecular chaperone DnaK [Candidatus Rokubacteria bacterium 13_1_20CM_2_69_58]